MSDVAVVVCTRDRPRMLETALAAIAQTISSSVEIVVVDSASVTEETHRVVEGTRARYVRSDVPGLSIARNIGWRASTRAYIVYTDDDCLAQPGWVDALIAPFSDPRVGAVTGLLLDEAAPVEAPEVVRPRVYEKVTDGIDAGHGAVMAFRRDLLESLGGFDPLLGAGRRLAGAEDFDAFCRILARGFRVVRDPRAIIRHVNTRSDIDYVALNRGYGLGLGALCAKWMQIDRRVGNRMLTIVVRRAIIRWLRGAAIPRRRKASSALTAAIFHGFRDARHIPVDGCVFVDERPPAAIPIAR